MDATINNDRSLLPPPLHLPLLLVISGTRRTWSRALLPSRRDGAWSAATGGLARAIFAALLSVTQELTSRRCCICGCLALGIHAYVEPPPPNLLPVKRVDRTRSHFRRAKPDECEPLGGFFIIEPEIDRFDLGSCFGEMEFRTSCLNEVQLDGEAWAGS